MVLLNEKRFNEWKEGLSPERVDKHFYKGWYWRSLNLTTKEDHGFYHRHFVFYKFNNKGKFLYHRYYWRTNNINEWNDREMAEQVIRNAIICGFWEEAKLE